MVKLLSAFCFSATVVGIYYLIASTPCDVKSKRSTDAMTKGLYLYSSATGSMGLASKSLSVYRKEEKKYHKAT